MEALQCGIKYLMAIQLCIALLPRGPSVSAQLAGYTSNGPNGGCTNKKILNASYGVYDFKDSLYLSDFCAIIKPKRHSVITVSIVKFDFFDETRELEYPLNYVEIANDEGSFLNITKMRYTGFVAPFTFTSCFGNIIISVHRELNFYGRGDLLIRFTTSEANTCYKDVTVDTYMYISSPPDANIRTWSVSLNNRANRKRELTLDLEILNWPTTSYALDIADLHVYDGKNGQLITSFDKVTGGRSRTGTHIYSNTGHMYIEYHVKYQRYATSRESFNATVKLKGVCIPGTSPCGDGENCYKDHELCDGSIQCSTAFDELGCNNCEATQFWCGSYGRDSQCFSQSQRCSGKKDCLHSNRDEEECHSCGHGAIRCKTDKKCIFERWLCDQELDCPDGSDEEGCTYPASRRVITAAIVGALVCSLLLVISLGCTCKLYSLRTAHSRRSVLHTLPLTRVEREIFARQAPPTYDMTVSGVDPEAASARRNRRRRSRRYPFQRSAPARNDAQVDDNREEGVQSSTTPTETPQNQTESSQNSQLNTNNTSRENNTQQAQQRRSSSLQSFGAFLFESMRSTLPAQTNPPVSSRPGAQNQGTRPAGNGGTRNQASSRSASRRSSSRSRNSRTSSSDQQAKALPKKKRILPVRVPAPYEGVAVEEDLLACVYPTPPSYTQAVSTKLEGSENDPDIDITVDTEANVSHIVPEIAEDSAAVNATLKTRTKSRFSFSFAQAVQRLAASSFRRFRQNPYLQMASHDSRRSSQQESLDGPSTVDNDHPLMLPSRARGSTSSDDDLLDCSISGSVREGETAGLLPTTVVQPPQDIQASSNRKVFPQKRLGNLAPGRSKDEDCNSINMFDLSSGDRV